MPQINCGYIINCNMAGGVISYGNPGVGGPVPPGWTCYSVGISCGGYAWNTYVGCGNLLEAGGSTSAGGYFCNATSVQQNFIYHGPGGHVCVAQTVVTNYKVGLLEAFNGTQVGNDGCSVQSFMDDQTVTFQFGANDIVGDIGGNLEGVYNESPATSTPSPTETNTPTTTPTATSTPVGIARVDCGYIVNCNMVGGATSFGNPGTGSPVPADWTCYSVGISCGGYAWNTYVGCGNEAEQGNPSGAD
ncbi:MAG TPA: hypothetical protein VNL71_10295, partial [Chloroflexota bacterium]|nr:hypothetical protein [Chloroflexota bacterium]